jgi:hypothetical protein
LARIRSIKPELRSSLTARQWPREVRYFWVLLWGYLDDYGRGIDEPALVRADCFPLDPDLDDAAIDEWLNLIATTEGTEGTPLCRYQIGRRRYLHAVHWREHQRPSHPTDSRIPPCPRHDDDGNLRTGSGGAHEQLAVASGTSPEPASSTITAGQTFAKSSGAPPEVLVPEQVIGGVDVDVDGGGETPPENDARNARLPHPLPDTFTITPEMRAWAKREHIVEHIDIDETTAIFIDYWRGNGKRQKDWRRAWQTWLRRDAKDARERCNRRTGTDNAAPPPSAAPKPNDYKPAWGRRS